MTRTNEMTMDDMFIIDRASTGVLLRELARRAAKSLTRAKSDRGFGNDSAEMRQYLKYEYADEFERRNERERYAVPIGGLGGMLR